MAEIREWLRKCKAEDDEKYQRLTLQMWTVIDKKIEELESERNRLAPENYDDECKKEFCIALIMLNELKMFSKELWHEYSMKGGDKD